MTSQTHLRTLDRTPGPQTRVSGTRATAVRRRETAVGVGIAVLAAAAAAWWLPRGAVTTGQAVTLLVGGSSIGAVLGVTVRSRWAYLVGPAAFVLAYEARWLGVDGPMTDMPRFDTILALLPVVFGRGWLGLLVLVPMTVGVAHARVWSRTRIGPADGSMDGPEAPAHRVVRILATTLVFALLVGLLWPSGTPAISDADGRPLDGSIAELTTVELGGHEQTLLLRGHDTSDPVLLYLEGGPGGTGLGAMRLFGGELERDLVVVSWDQRGTGTSYPGLEPKDTLTLDRAVDDLLELTDHLRSRFDEERIYLLGNSWGTTLAVLAAQREPDRFHAIISTGQMVSQRETDRRMYEQMIADARRAGNNDRVHDLEALGPPPFPDIADYAPLLVQPSDRPEVEWPANVLVSEYTLLDKVNSGPALVETFATLYPQLQDIDFRRDVPELRVPLYVVDGDQEDPARSELADEWLADLDAPRIRHHVITDAGHRSHLQQPEEFAGIVRRILDETAIDGEPVPGVPAAVQD
jgi:proline iminopeptidase